MATAWLIEAGDDDLLDLGELSPVAPETRPTATLDVSPLGEISPVDANRQRVPAARAGSKPFPFAPSPAVKGATRAGTSATAACPRSPAFAPSPLAPKRAAQREPTKNSPGTLAGAGAAPAPAQAPSPIFKPPLGGSRAAVAAAEPVPRRRPSAAEPSRGGGLSRHSRRQSLGLDAFQSIAKGLLEEDDDFDFAPSFTPKAAKGPGAFAPSPVREEEEDVAEEEAAVEEAKAGALKEIVEEEEEEAAAEAAVEPAAEPHAPPAAEPHAPPAAEPDVPPAASKAAEDRAPVAPEPPIAPEPPETAEADDAFERKLRAAMEAAERGGGLAGLSGGVQNSPPGGSTARPAAVLSPVPDPALSADPRRDETCDEVHSDDDTVELQADVDVSMMDAETSAPTPVSGGGGAAPRAPAAVLAALASPAEGSRTLAEEPSPMPASREENARETPRPNHDEAPSKESAPETAEADDAFERKLRAAMEAAERGGGLAGLSGGVQNSPPGCADHRTAGVTEDDARASGPVPDEKEETRMAEATASRKRPVPGAKAKGKGKAPTEPDPEPEKKEASVDDDAFERKLLAAMEAAERGGGLAGLSGGMQNSPPGSKPAKPTEAAAAPEISGSGDAADACGMDHDAPPTPKEPQNVLALSPVAAAPASAKKRDAKPPRSGKKSKRARTPRRAPRRDENENEKAEMNDSRAEDGTRSVEGEDEDGPSPPAADFEAMLASAIAAADGGDVDAVLGGASSKVMNSPAPARRETRERPVRTRAAEAKTSAATPTRVSTRRGARVTRDSAAKTPNRAASARMNTPTPRGKRRATPTPLDKTPEKKSDGFINPKPETSARDARVSSKPAWVSSVDPEPRAREEKEGAGVRASLDRSSSDRGGASEDDVSPVPEAPAAPPPPPTAWLKKAAEAKTRRKPGWVSQAGAPAAPVVAAPVAPIAAPVVLAALAAAQSRAKASTEGVDGFDFEAKLQAALAAEAGGGEAAFGGASKVANSPARSGEKRTEFSAKEEARRQGVTVAQIMHARAHADSSPLTKVRF